LSAYYVGGADGVEASRFLRAIAEKLSEHGGEAKQLWGVNKGELG
jgi:hypothetical protein